VVGDIYANGIECVRALFKRSIAAGLHQISKKHLDRYVEEMKRRFNNRNIPHVFRDTVRRILSSDPLRFRELVDKKAAWFQSPAVDPSCPARPDKPRPSRRPSTRASRLSMSANRCAVSRRPAKISAPSATPTLRIPINSALMALPALIPIIPFALIFPANAVQGIRGAGLLKMQEPCVQSSGRSPSRRRIYRTPLLPDGWCQGSAPVPVLLAQTQKGTRRALPEISPPSLSPQGC